MARLVYLGSPEVAVPPLRSLVDAGHDVALVVSQPDKRRGRGGEVSPSPVKRAALDLGLAVSDRVDDVIATGAELGVVVAFGRLIKPHVLAAVPMVNIHFSLLPRWRGAAPVEWALLSGDDTTGVCLMELEEGLDTGPVYERAEVEITEDDTLESLRDRLGQLGTDILLRRVSGGRSTLGVPVPQSGEATYAPKLSPAHLRLDWDLPASDLRRRVRLGGAWTTLDGRRLRVLDATDEEGAGEGPPGALHGTAVTTGSGVLRLLKVQPEGKAGMDADAWRRGARLGDGATLGG